MEGQLNVSYGIGKVFWGKGYATLALKRYLQIITTRPLYGRVAYDNFGSKKVLENCGFVVIATEKGFAEARGQEIAEFVLKLEK